MPLQQLTEYINTNACNVMRWKMLKKKI